ncbi:unnamed protein product [Diatraea saccharalis]|uniref:Uncharacterized protein n=1 Tax=Diatraea saccharalis TaxID=40085 RepID=A0A9N9R8N1_9NEOP|nr:unnamed protein product [Diatraea saccharalis]
MHGTGGGPASTLKLSDLEQRVLSIIGTRAATGIVEIPELGIEDDVEPEMNESPSIFEIHEVIQQQTSSRDWNQPGTSTQPYRFSPLLVPSEEAGREDFVSVNNPGVTVDTNETHVTSRTSVESVVTGTANARPRTQQSPTALPPTPRRRRRRLIQAQSPLHRRTRTQTQSDLARQAFVRSDCEWRSFQQEVEQEKIRLRELELSNQQRCFNTTLLPSSSSAAEPSAVNLVDNDLHFASTSMPNSSVTGQELSPPIADNNMNTQTRLVNNAIASSTNLPPTAEYSLNNSNPRSPKFAPSNLTNESKKVGKRRLRALKNFFCFFDEDDGDNSDVWTREN